MEEHKFAEGCIRNGHLYRYCSHCSIVLFYYKCSKPAQIQQDIEREFYIELARKFNVK